MAARAAGAARASLSTGSRLPWALRPPSAIWRHARLPAFCPPSSPPQPAASVCRRAGRWLSSRAGDLYAALGVGRRATTEEIKMAYYREAKKNHPDLNPSRDAAIRFRQVAEAYEVLKDPARRRSYDLGGSGAPSGGMGGSADWQDVDPMRVFRTVWRDFGLGDLELYLKRVSQEGTDAFAAATDGRRDFGPAKRFASDHRGVILTTVVPLLLVLRYPAAAFAAARGGLLVALGAFRFIPHELRYQLLSRAWLAAVSYLERMSKESAGSERRPRPPSGPGSGVGGDGGEQTGRRP